MRLLCPLGPILASALCLLAALPAQLDLRESEERDQARDWLIVPYAFRSDSLDTAFGLAGGTRGLGQPNTRLAAAVLGSTNGSKALYLGFTGTRLGERLFLDGFASAGEFTRLRAYGGGGPDDPGRGNNESSELDFIEGEGVDNWLDLRLRYVLPIGRGADQPRQVVNLRRGLWDEDANPAPTFPGYLRAELRPLIRDFRIQHSDDPGVESDYDMAGFAVSLEHDATDFPFDPGQGSQQRITIKQGLDLWGDTETWTTIEAQLTGYVPLPHPDWARRSVLALELWTADTPSWGDDFTGRPPPYEGARLGGLFRMRGFDVHRFQDRAALFAGAEYRITPDWNPFSSWRKESYAVDWLQLAVFGEIGRVAPTWSLRQFTEDLRWDAGVGIRAYALDSVLRFDVAFSSEDMGVWVMIGQSTFAR